MVNASRITYPHYRGARRTAGPSMLRPAMPMLSRPCPHPVHVITVDIHEFRNKVVHTRPGRRQATTAHGTKQDRRRSCYGQPAGPAGYLTAAGDRT